MPPEKPSPGEEIPDVDVDALLSEAKEPKEARAVEDEEAPAAKEEPSPWWSSIELDVSGKKIKPDSEEKARTWMQQGYNYSQRAGELNAKERQWAQERTELLSYKEKFNKYAPIEEYGAKNPDWLKHLHETWNNRSKVGAELDPNISKAISPLQEELAQVKSYVDELKQAREAQAAEAAIAAKEEADKNLNTEMESIRKLHPTMDFEGKDEIGKTLEDRVLEHAVKIHTSSYRAAFRDYLHDQLVEGAKANGKEAVVKTTQLAAKKGIIGTSQTPTKELKTVNTKLPWNDSSLKGEAILREMGLL